MGTLYYHLNFSVNLKKCFHVKFQKCLYNAAGKHDIKPFSESPSQINKNLGSWEPEFREQGEAASHTEISRGDEVYHLNYKHNPWKDYK